MQTRDELRSKFQDSFPFCQCFLFFRELHASAYEQVARATGQMISAHANARRTALEIPRQFPFLPMLSIFPNAILPRVCASRASDGLNSFRSCKRATNRARNSKSASFLEMLSIFPNALLPRVCASRASDGSYNFRSCKRVTNRARNSKSVSLFANAFYFSERSTAARMNSLKSGPALFGRLLNSGWNCTPSIHG